MSLSDYLLAELRHSAERPTLAKIRERLAGRTPVVADRLGFAQQALVLASFLGHRVADALDRHRLARLLVDGAVDLAHAPGADLGLGPVAADLERLHRHARINAGGRWRPRRG
jgi:hypothetical protein